MKYKNLTIVGSFILFCVFILQGHSGGRANGNNRDNTGAPGGQTGGNGSLISCQNCHSGGNFEVGLTLELLDVNDNPIEQYTPNEIYMTKVTITSLSGAAPNGYGFQMVSLFDADDSDVNGWVDSGHSDNVQLAVAASTGRVYAEHDGVSSTNEFIAEWQAPASNSGDISFYLAGVGVNGNGGSSGDHTAIQVKMTLSELITTSTFETNQATEIAVYPNPTAQNINIKGAIKNKFIEIYQSEKLVRSIKSENENLQLSLGNLGSGIYFVVIKNEDNQIITAKKVIKN